MHSWSLSTQFQQEREEEPEEKMPQTLLHEERASNVCILGCMSTSDTKKRHLNQDQVAASTKKQIRQGNTSFLSIFSRRYKCLASPLALMTGEFIYIVVCMLHCTISMCTLHGNDVKHHWILYLKGSTYVLFNRHWTMWSGGQCLIHLWRQSWRNNIHIDYIQRGDTIYLLQNSVVWLQLLTLLLVIVSHWCVH